jgi:hypothetical protein
MDKNLSENPSQSTHPEPPLVGSRVSGVQPGLMTGAAADALTPNPETHEPLRGGTGYQAVRNQAAGTGPGGYGGEEYASDRASKVEDRKTGDLNQYTRYELGEGTPPDDSGGSKKVMIFAILGALVFLAGLGLAVYGLMLPTTDTPRIRDIFIISMALISMLTLLALVVLLVQLARLINLLQNEIKPILDSTNETMSHLRGTTVFLSDNLVEPVIKLNEYVAGLSQLVQILGLARKPKRNQPPRGE